MRVGYWQVAPTRWVARADSHASHTPDAAKRRGQPGSRPDRDAAPDAFIASQRRTPGLLLRNLGDARFERIVATAPATDSLVAYSAQPAPVTGDFDNDGDLDFVVARWGAAPSLFVNNGDGTFRVGPTPGSGGDLTQRISFKGSIAASDYDLDGDLDLYLGNWPDMPGPDEENVLFRNDSQGRVWLRVELEGTKANRSAIGARLFVSATIGGTSITQRRDVRAQSTFRSMDDLVQHVGLGDASGVDSVVVRWPSGALDTSRQLPVRANLRIIEGRGWMRPGGAVTACR